MTCKQNNGEGCTSYQLSQMCEHIYKQPHTFEPSEKPNECVCGFLRTTTGLHPDTRTTGEHTESLIERAIQVDLDNGRFMQICSNESTFKEYIFPLIAAAESKGRREAGKEVREYVEEHKGSLLSKTVLLAKLDTAFPLE